MNPDVLTGTQLVAVIFCVIAVMLVIGLTLLFYGVKGYTGKHRRRDHERVDRARE